MEYVKRPPGASAEALEEVERKFHVELPVDLRQFWSESEGPILWFGHKELQFFSIPDVIEDFNNVAKHMPGAIPLCMDGSGNVCVARVSDGRVSGYFVASCGDLGWEGAVELSKEFFQFLRDPKSPEARLSAGHDA